MNPLKDIDWQPQPAYAAVAALSKGDVAAAMAIEPFSAMLESSGAARSLIVQDMPPMEMDYCCGVVAGSLLRTDRPNAAAITRALLRGSAWAAAHPTETARVVVAVVAAGVHHPQHGWQRSSTICSATSLSCGAGVSTASLSCGWRGMVVVS